MSLRRNCLLLKNKFQVYLKKINLSNLCHLKMCCFTSTFDTGDIFYALAIIAVRHKKPCVGIFQFLFYGWGRKDNNSWVIIATTK